MLRETQFTAPAGSRRQDSWLGGARRWVRARIVVAGHEVDAFDVSSPTSLDLALDPALVYLPATNAHVEFAGVTASWAFLGLGRRNYVTFLASRAQAYAFLGWSEPSAAGRVRSAERRRGHATTGERPSAMPWPRRERELPRGDRSRVR